MKRGISLFLITCITLGLVGCEQTGPKNTEQVEETQSQSDQTESETESESSGNMRLIDLTARERGTLHLETMTEKEDCIAFLEIFVHDESEEYEVKSYLIAEEKVFYILQGAKLEVHSLDIATGEDQILYTYEEEYYHIGISNLQYGDGYLIWREYILEYELQMYEEKTYTRYVNLSDGTTYKEPYETLYGPLEVIGTMGDVTTSYRQGVNWTKITIDDGNQVTQLAVSGQVTDTMSNGYICVWNKPGTYDNLTLYDMVNDKLYSLGGGNFSPKNICVYDEWLLIDQSDGVFAYNIPEGFYTKLCEEDVGEFHVETDGLYVEINDDNEFKLLYVK